MSWHQIWAHFSNFTAKNSLVEYCIFKLFFSLSWAVKLSQIICVSAAIYKKNNCKFHEIPGKLRLVRNVAYNYRTLEEWTIDNQSDCRNFTIYAALLMLIGCLEQEFLKNGLNSDVNSTLKSDLITDINFNKSTESSWETDT